MPDRCPFDTVPAGPLNEEEFATALYKAMVCQVAVWERAPSATARMTHTMALMRSAVRLAIDTCRTQGAEPELDGVLDLCRDAFVAAMKPPERNLN